MAQHDYDIANQSFPSFRSDLNSVLEAINTSNSGTSRPSSAVAGTIWLDTTSASTPTLKFYDGSDDISLATLDYTANTVNWLDSTVTISSLSQDLDVNGNSIISSANGNITITPDGTGKVVIDGLSYPTADGTADQVLTTDGAGNLTFADASGGGTQWQSSIVTGTTLSAIAGNGYWIDTTSNACTVTLPASANVGDTIEFVDYARNWGTNSVTLNRNGLNYQGGTENAIYDTDGQSVRIVYSGATQGWIPTSDDDVTDEANPPILVQYLVVAGGGGGGLGNAGGGGAGGYLTNYGGTPIIFTGGTTYTVTVGEGGAGKDSPTGQGSNGADSVLSGSGISTITAIGGGGGGSGASGQNDGLDGGSGGGGAYNGTGGAGTAPQGNAGGSQNTSAPEYGAGGGGGAGAVGGSGTDSAGGDGGVGVSNSITGSAVFYAGGGGGSVNTSTIANAGVGGNGGGGDGGAGSAAAGTDGTANTGGGGGGSESSNVGTAGDGGSGVVILRMPTARYSGTTTGSPTVDTDGTDTVIKFTASGSYTA